MIRSTLIRAIAALGAITSLAFATDDAEASYNVGAASGKPFWPADAGCFQNSGAGGLTNNCPAPSRYLVWYPHVDNDVGITTTYVNFTGTGQCISYVFTYAGGYVTSSANIVSSGSMSLGSTYYAPNHFVEIRCLLAQSSTVRSVYWQ